MPVNGFDKRPQDINRNGRPPKAWTMSTLIEEALEEVETQSGTPFKKLVAKKLATMAVSGDIQAIKEINDRVDGRPQQKIQHSGEITGNVIVFTDFSQDADETEGQ